MFLACYYFFSYNDVGCALDGVNNSSLVWENSTQSPCSAWERVHLQEQHERISFLNKHKYNIACRNAKATSRICPLESRAVMGTLGFDVALEGQKWLFHCTQYKISWENYIVQSFYIKKKISPKNTYCIEIRKSTFCSLNKLKSKTC